jgi:glycerol-3-phosphate dehydrogenase (NAD(P)+)
MGCSLGIGKNTRAMVMTRAVREMSKLGAGKPIDEIIVSMNQVAEGVNAASVVMEFADSYGIATPIAREVDGVVNHGATPEGAYRGLAAEKPGHEVHGAGF